MYELSTLQYSTALWSSKGSFTAPRSLIAIIADFRFDYGYELDNEQLFGTTKFLTEVHKIVVESNIKAVVLFTMSLKLIGIMLTTLCKSLLYFTFPPILEIYFVNVAMYRAHKSHALSTSLMHFNVISCSHAYMSISHILALFW